MDFTQTDRGIEVPLTDTFHLEETFQCGQCFRWRKQEDGSFAGIALGKYCRISGDIDNKTIVFHNISMEEFEQIWVPYFDLETDYAAIRSRLVKLDPVMAEAAAFAPGIRILRQDPWEALCSFIISQNNNIPRIQGIVDRLCETFGEPVEGGYAFPTPERMAQLTVEDLAPLRSGFRAKYLCSAAKLVADGTVDLQSLYTLPLPEARAMLMQIHGVGPKVAECVLLYGLHRMACFPMDVWIKRAMAVLFPGKDSCLFGEDAGMAQQYIFHYSRSHPQLFDESIKI